ncbi:DUF362 domain-containing protein [Neobacillus muris]|uniref:DUF362 domain-containing protein n=1 Tax=Neobacillus muris TaxID=2941334 RepID=UPI0020408BEC|nr:4Fe-4S binding protein [Neobacillus muris]
MSFLTKWLESMHVDMEITKICSRKRNPRSSCSYCADACKLGAIRIGPQAIEINTDLCHDCGKCMISCPLSAIVGIPIGRNFENGSLDYNHEYSISEKELLIYKKKGMESIAAHGSSINEQWKTAIEEANQKLALMGHSPIQLLSIPDEEKLTRRKLFSSFKKRGRQLTPAAWRIQSGEWTLTKHYSEYQFYTVQVEKEKCSICHACFYFCTQNVFMLEAEALRIDSEKCVNCKDCTDICPESAIRITPEIKKKSICRIPVYYHICPRCNTEFPSFHKSEDECPICKERDSDWLSPLV